MRFRKDEGFTLVELMVVVLIIGILIAVAVPVFNSARANAQKRTCQATQRTVEGAYQTWYADDPLNAGIAADAALLTTLAHVEGILIPNFIKAAPICPSGGVVSAVVRASDATSPRGLSIDIQCTIAGHVN